MINTMQRILTNQRDNAADKFFYDAAQHVLKAGTTYLATQPEPTNEQIYDLFTQSPSTVRAAILTLTFAQQGAATYLDDGRTAARVLSILYDAAMVTRLQTQLLEAQS